MGHFYFAQNRTSLTCPNKFCKRGGFNFEVRNPKILGNIPLSEERLWHSAIANFALLSAKQFPG